jgi:gamma-glutamyltranspeptidase/glutathione hydrolase
VRPGILIALLVLTMTYYASPQDRSYGRSVVVTDRGIVATSHYLASQAGAQVLAQGGSDRDAAIDATAVHGDCGE